MSIPQAPMLMSSYLPPVPTPKPWLYPADETLFWTEVDKLPNGCWHYTGGTKGQMRARAGIFTHARGNIAAHRCAWRLLRGEKLPGTIYLKPDCGDDECINPDHQLKVKRNEVGRRIERKRQTGPSMAAHPSYRGLMTAEEILVFLQRPGVMVWTSKLGNHHCWSNDTHFDGETIEAAVRAARDAA